jgi:hydrogenase expression/formation protein HypE
VKPLFFPGGDIGSLAVHGTVNDLAMGGAEPLFLSIAFILEEGLSLDVLGRIVHSVREAACAAGVQIVTGDTKVVEKGSGDQLFINTTGIGLVPDGVILSSDRVRPGDKVLLSGTLGDHGIAILAKREGLEFESEIQSDSAALHGLVADMLSATSNVRCMRDPTRGGLSSALNEIASRSGARDTELEGLHLAIEWCPRRHRCRNCQCEFKVREYDFQCPQCRAVATGCVSGNELELAYLEVEEHESSPAGTKSSQRE